MILMLLSRADHPDSELRHQLAVRHPGARQGRVRAHALLRPALRLRLRVPQTARRKDHGL